MQRYLPLFLGLLSSFVFAESADHLISLHSARIDTLAGDADVATGRARALAPGEAGRYLVKFPGPIKAEEHAELARRVERIDTYLPHYAYLVKATPEVALALPEIGARWVGRFHPAYKISPDVAAVSAASPQGLRRVMVHVFPDADLSQVSARIQAAGAVPVAEAAGDLFSRIRLLVEPGHLASLRDRLAGMPEVFYLDLEPRLGFLNDSTRWVGQSGTGGGQATPVYDHGIYGEGQIVGVMDTGLDADMCYYWDGALPLTNECTGGINVDPNARKVLAVDFIWQNECNNGIAIWEWDSNGHGTHVAGTVAGDRGNNGIPDQGDGMAPAAKLVIQDCGYSVDNCADCPGLGCPVADLKPYFQQAYDQGARIHTNSYGDNENATLQNDYTAASQDVDQFMWDHPEFLIFFAAGNSGPGNDTVGSPSTAKSCVSVGATQPGSSAESMADFSSCGYTDDGRYKPEVVIPGENISSAANDWLVITQNCGLTALSGTSMASPGAAGLAALARQYFTDGFHPSGTATPADAFTPTGALVRAVLANSAADMTGEPAIPTRCQGWGRIQLDNALAFPGDPETLHVFDDPGFSTGSQVSRSYQFDVASGSVPLKITLAWTDYPSTPAASPHLNNDLDLTIIAPDATTYRGNVFSGGVSASGGTSDRLNTLEQILVPNPDVGAWQLTVTANNVPNGPQPFALVITGDATLSTSVGAYAEISAGSGPGPANPPEIRMYNAGLNRVASFVPFGTTGYGADVASGSFDPDVEGEHVSGPGPSPVFGPQVRGFDAVGTAVSKVNLYAYGTLRFGVNVGLGDVDADGMDEIETGAGAGAVFGPHVRGFDFDGTSIGALPGLSFFAYQTLKYGTNLASGPIDTDPRSAIVTGPGPGAVFGPQVRGFRYPGGGVTSLAKLNLFAFAGLRYGASVATGDFDDDGFHEIVAGPGPDAVNLERLAGFDYDGANPIALFDHQAGPTPYGARAALGDLTGPAAAEMLAVQGPDPASAASVTGWSVSSGNVTPIPALDFPPFGAMTHGARLSVYDLGSY